MTIRSIVFFLLLCLGGDIAYGTKPVIDDMVSLLEKSPSWSSITEDNISNKGVLLTKTFAQISKLSLSEVEEIISIYMKKYPPNSLDVSAWSKIYAFNRFYFRVTDPKYGNLITSDFGGIWIRDNNEIGNESWPWREENNNKKVVLTGFLKAYTGGMYRGFEEFKLFKNQFIVRSQQN